MDVDGTFDIKYGSETITVEYDEDITPGISVDRNDAPPGSQVHTTITDFRLNLDPTKADVWTFDSSATKSTARSVPAPSTQIRHHRLGSWAKRRRV